MLLFMYIYNSKGEEKYSEELEALQRESEMPLDDILDSLPLEMIKHLTSEKRKPIDEMDDDDDKSVSDDE